MQEFLDAHAQREIRAYAEAISALARHVCPLAFEAFDDEIAGGVRLSGTEATAVGRLLRGEPLNLDEREHRILAEKLGIAPSS